MKIDSGMQPVARQQGKDIKGSSVTKGEGGKAKKTDGEAFSVKLSPTTEKLLSTAPAEDEVRMEKVAAIRSQLASGNYNISGKDVAAKILNALKG